MRGVIWNNMQEVPGSSCLQGDSGVCGSSTEDAPGKNRTLAHAVCGNRCSIH